MFTSHRTKPKNTTLSKGTRGERLVLFGRVFLFKKLNKLVYIKLLY